MGKVDRINAHFDDEAYRYAFAHQYHLDPDKDLDLMKRIHAITTVRHVYDAKQNSSESVIEYFNDIKNFVTSEQYHNMDEVGKRSFEHHVFEILKGITIKGIWTEHFITGSIHYLSRPDINDTSEIFRRYKEFAQEIDKVEPINM